MCSTVELRVNVASTDGFEPPTLGIKTQCSTQLSYVLVEPGEHSKGSYNSSGTGRGGKGGSRTHETTASQAGEPYRQAPPIHKNYTIPRPEMQGAPACSQPFAPGFSKGSEGFRCNSYLVSLECAGSMLSPPWGPRGQLGASLPHSGVLGIMGGTLGEARAVRASV